MSSYHVLSASRAGISYTLEVEYHIPVPDEAIPLTGSQLRTLVAGDAGIDKASVVADVPEQAQIDSGEVLLVKEPIKPHEGKSDIAIRNLIRARYDDLAVAAIDKLRARFRVYGFSEDKGPDF